MEKHIELCFQFGYKSDFLGILETAHCQHVFCRNRICSNHHSSLPCRRFLKDMRHCEKDPTSIFCVHRKSKHVDTSHHFIPKLVNDGQISLLFCASKEQLANMFTKPLGTLASEFQRQHLGTNSDDNIVPVEIKGVC